MTDTRDAIYRDARIPSLITYVGEGQSHDQRLDRGNWVLAWCHFNGMAVSAFLKTGTDRFKFLGAHRVERITARPVALLPAPQPLRPEFHDVWGRTLRWATGLAAEDPQAVASGGVLIFPLITWSPDGRYLFYIPGTLGGDEPDPSLEGCGSSFLFSVRVDGSASPA